MLVTDLIKIETIGFKKRNLNCSEVKAFITPIYLTYALVACDSNITFFICTLHLFVIIIRTLHIKHEIYFDEI